MYQVIVVQDERERLALYDDDVVLLVQKSAYQCSKGMPNIVVPSGTHISLSEGDRDQVQRLDEG